MEEKTASMKWLCDGAGQLVGFAAPVSFPRCASRTLKQGLAMIVSYGLTGVDRIVHYARGKLSGTTHEARNLITYIPSKAIACLVGSVENADACPSSASSFTATNWYPKLPMMCLFYLVALLFFNAIFF
jgi:hypothetical protein